MVSNLENQPIEVACAAGESSGETLELLHGREVTLSPRDGTIVTRTLPNKERRMVGAWCFVDQYGPTDVAGKAGMQVAAHPHTALQTVSWLVAGEVHHYDSLGSSQVIRPGQLNLMTAGSGIAHAELSPAGHGPLLHGAQLWVALPSGSAGVAPGFEHHADLPVIDMDGGSVTVMMGTLGGVTSPARTYTPLVGAEIWVEPAVELPLDPAYEHALLVLSGEVEVGLVSVPQGPLLYLGSGRSSVRVMAHSPARVLLLGGEPFGEEIVMWWNFIGRSHEEIVHMRQSWEEGQFAEVGGGYTGSRLPAPALPITRLKPRGRLRG